MDRLLLILVTVALVAAPLRGSFALPVPAAADEAEDCAHLQDGMQGMVHATDRHEAGAGQPDPGCDPGCAGDCCGGKCGTCAHASIALPGATLAIAGRYSRFHSVPVLQHCAGRTVHPPFRPPIILS